MTYVFHRYGLHSRQSPLTKTHTNWQHTISPPFSLVAHYDHPFAYLIHIFLPSYLPAMIFRFHLLTYLLYLAVISLEETFAYSGYNMLPNFILGGVARRQEKHLMGGGNGNYGCLGLVDFVTGTSIGEDLLDDVIDDAEEKQIAKKTKRNVKAAGKKVLKKPPKKKQDTGGSEEEEGAQREAAEKEEEEEPPLEPKTSPKKSGKKGADTHEEDANDKILDEENESLPKRPARTRRREKNSSEEDAEAGGQDEGIKAEEKSRPKARGVARKGSLKSKSGSRLRKRSEDNDK